MIRVHAPSRLHFGLFGLPREEFWPNRLGEKRVSARRFGGVGLMVESPGVAVSVRPAAEWSAAGPLAERALEYAKQVTESPLHVQVERCGPQHAGLGTGTQLGLAVARAILASGERQSPDGQDLALVIGRGRRSAIGVHGFAQGGFIVEGGQRRPDELSPLVARVDFPLEWPIVLAIPTFAQGLHGHAERQAFERLLQAGAAPTDTDALCRLTLLGMLPALAEQDWRAFGESLFDFNYRVGELFAAVQGGPYAHPRLQELVAFVRHQGIAGTGQSSWGPTVFAVAEDVDQAGFVVRQLRERFHLTENEVLTTTPCNGGARLSTG